MSTLQSSESFLILQFDPMASSAALHVLSSPDLLRYAALFQDGLYEDMLPFSGWFAPDTNQSFDRLLNAMDLFHPFWEPTFTTWYKQFDKSRLCVLFRLLPRMLQVVALEAAVSGRIAVLQYMLAQGLLDGLSVHWNNLAAAFGQSLVMAFFDEHKYPGCDKMALDRAAESGHLSVVQYLLAKDDPSPCALNLAAKHGHENVVRLLHESNAPCTTFAMDWAAKEGHLDIVKFLHNERSEGCTAQAMSWAAANGHLDIVSFLHYHRSEGCTRQALIKAAENDHIDVVKFFVEHRREGCIIKARAAAAQRGRVQVASFLTHVAGVAH